MVRLLNTDSFIYFLFYGRMLRCSTLSLSEFIRVFHCVRCLAQEVSERKRVLTILYELLEFLFVIGCLKILKTTGKHLLSNKI